MAKKKSIFWFSSLAIIFASLTLIYVLPSRIDPSLLTDMIRESDMIQIYDKELDEVMYETSDEIVIQRFSDYFIADRNSPQQTIMGWYPHRYFLLFHSDSKLIAKIALKEDLSFHWYDSAWAHDFRLTSESYCVILPWLCEKTGKKLTDFARLPPGWEYFDYMKTNSNQALERTPAGAAHR